MVKPELPPRFGRQVSEAIDRNLSDAARQYTDKPRAEALLLEALARDAECLPIYFALYKFYFYANRLVDAEAIVLRALGTAAGQAGMARDWSLLTRGSAAWQDTSGPAHFYLFTIKALAFIRLRLGRHAEAAALLEKLFELDPDDSVGASVIQSLANATT